MTDRELLEMAAKAVGITGSWVRWHQTYGDSWIEGLDCGGPVLWNPMADDGDALRLAVKLGFFIDSYAPATTVGNVICPASLACKTHMEDHNGDQYAATRRAIVRAAADIGKTKS